MAFFIIIVDLHALFSAFVTSLFYTTTAIKNNVVMNAKIDKTKGRLVPSQVRWRIVLPLPSLFEGSNFTYVMIIAVHTFYISRMFGFIVHNYFSEI